MRQKCVKIASKMRGTPSRENTFRTIPILSLPPSIVLGAYAGECAAESQAQALAKRLFHSRPFCLCQAFTSSIVPADTAAKLSNLRLQEF